VPVPGQAKRVGPQTSERSRQLTDAHRLAAHREDRVGAATDHGGQREKGQVRVEGGVGEASPLQAPDGPGVTGQEGLATFQAERGETLVDGPVRGDRGRKHER